MNNLNTLGRVGLFLTVFLTGAGVMVIELLGTRLIAPFYGASLYVWSSLISVTMMALAVGYFIGGRWADSAKRTGLSLIIGLSAVLTLLIPLFTHPVLVATDPLGLRAGAFVSALVLFFPSLMFLGMVGPFAIKMATWQIDGVGKSAGNLYAVSTLGSVIGTLVLGFFLFPALGSREILIGLGVVLLLLAVVVGVYERHHLHKSAVLFPCVVLALVGLSVLPSVVGAGHRVDSNAAFKIRSEQESLYGWVRVIDQPAQDLRLLTSDASAIGASSIANGQSRLSYQTIVGMIPALTPQHKMTRALIIGLGAGHMAQVLRDKYGMVTDTLEIDPAVARAARDFFGYQPTGQAIVGDGRYEIRRLHGTYDLIIHDCFTGGSEPAHLLTQETLERLRGLLSEQGILALNFVSFANRQQTALASVSKTLAQVFPVQTTFVSEPGKDFNDFIFLSSRQAIDLNSSLLMPEQVSWLKDRVFSVDTRLGVVLTDNFNPLEHLQTAKAEYYRHFIVDVLGADLLIR